MAFGHIDERIKSRFQAVQKDPGYRPILDKIEAATEKGISSQEMLQVAMQATVDEFKRTGKPLDKQAIRDKAFTAAAAASMEKPFQLSDLPEGKDKSNHFLVSSLIAIKVSEVAHHVMPAFMANALGRGVSKTIGVLKEIWDKVSGGDADIKDIHADFAGAARPFQVAVPVEQNKKA
jgi:uncharacterized protein YfiM (DUF2279 family)